jgi:hypothetical protein
MAEGGSCAIGAKCLSATLLALALTSPRSAMAQSSSSDAAELFERGRAALMSKNYAAACPAFEASLKLERAVGTLISLAQCLEATGKVASARQRWREASELAVASRDPLDRAPLAKAKAEELERRVPRLTVELEQDAPVDTIVARDGVDLPSAGLGVSFPVDPGPHSLRVSAAGRAERVITIDLAEGEKKTVRVGPGPLPVLPSEASPGATQRIAAWIVGGVGVAGLGVGAATGLAASLKWSSAKTDCGGGCPRGAPARTEYDDAQRLATISTISVILGAAALATGTALYLTAPTANPRARVELVPSVSADRAVLVVARSW